MAIIPPAPIAAYFAADGGDSPEAVSRCFTDDATVTDEGDTHRGRLAIAAWKADATTKYSYALEPFSIGTQGDRIVVACHLEGDFLGSPLDLRFIFTVRDDKIAELEIIP
jgi:hypothetical protein